MAAPTRLSGVEAPEVRPTDTGPGGSQLVGRHLGLGAHGPVPNLDRRHQAVGIGDVERRPRRGADPGQIAGVAAVVARRSRSSGRPAVSRSSATTASCRSCVALQIVSNAWKCADESWLRRSDRSSPPSTSRRSRATPTSASSSGWRRPIRCRSRSGSKPGDAAPAKRARKASRSTAAADVVADDCRSRDRRRRRDSGRRLRPPATRSPAFPRATPCRE